MKPYFVLSALGRQMHAAGKRFKQEPPFGTWYLRYRDAYGVKQRVVCDARTEAEALVRNAERQAQENAIREGRATRRTLTQLTWEQLRDSYLAASAHLGSQAPMRSQFKCWFDPAWKGRPIASIGPADCLALLNKARAAEQKPATVRQLRVRGRLVFKHAIEVLEVLEANPWDKVKVPPAPKRLPVFLRKEQVDALLLAAGRWRLLLLVAVLTGARRGELGGLQWTDFAWEEGAHGVLRLRRSWGRDIPKGRKERPIPLHPYLAQELRQAAKRAGDELYVFPAPRRGGMRHESWHVAKLLRSIARAAGVTLPEGCTFHSLRKTFATHLYRKTGDMTVPQRLLGHGALTLTDAVYVGQELEHLEEAVARLDFGVPAQGEQKPNTRATEGAGVVTLHHQKGK